MKILKFGEDVDGYNIPVLNEREIRAGAGIFFVVLFLSLMLAIFKENFVLFKYAITVFLVDMLIRVFINPKYSPVLILGRLIVRKQVPEYVGAPQKKFAWIISVILSFTMFIHMVILNGYSPITGVFCLTCLIFLFFETSFGICIGCKIYPLFNKGKVQYCPGEICEIKDRQSIQKTSRTQLLILVALIVGIFMTAFLFNDFYSKKPYDIFGIENAKTPVNYKEAS
jgi:hypothetical protein